MIKTGINDLDEIIRIKDNDLIVVAGVKGIGKTTLVSNIIANTDKSILVFPLEENKDTLIERILSIRNLNNIKHLNSNKSNDTDNIIIESNSHITIQGIISKSKEMKTNKDIRLIVIDRLELIKNYYEQKEEIIRQLKEVSQKLNVPIILTSELSKIIKIRRNPIPLLEDIRNEAINKIADVILFFHRDDYYNKYTEKPNISDIIIVKPINKRIETLWVNGYDKIVSLEKYQETI